MARIPVQQIVQQNVWRSRLLGGYPMTRLTLAALLLSACAPGIDRQDCAETATWRGACESRDMARAAPEPEQPGGHWATRDNEPDSRADPEGHRDWQRDRDAQREEGTG